MADIKLKDNKGVERVYEGVEAVTVPSASGGDMVEFNHAADWIVEEGTSGFWNYEKWHSGKAVCYGKLTITVSGWTAWGSIFEGTQSDTTYVNYPSNLFIATPDYINVSLNGTPIGGQTVLGWEIYTGGSKDRSPSIYPLRPIIPQTSPSQFLTSIYVVGRWK